MTDATSIEARGQAPAQDLQMRRIDVRPRAPVRIQIVSDVIGSPRPLEVVPVPDIDFVVAAGDIANSAVDAVHLLRDTFPATMPVVMVLGDRDLAGADHSLSITRARAAARDRGVTLLEKEAAVIRGVRFVGATFWTDFRLSGDGTSNIEVAMDAAEARFSELDVRTAHRHLDPYGSMWEHANSKVELTMILRERFRGLTVVVTHHAPSALCLSSDLRGDVTAATLASRCEDTVRSSEAAVWIHGHVPGPVDVAIGATRVVAAPHRPGHGPTVIELVRPDRTGTCELKK